MAGGPLWTEPENELLDELRGDQYSAEEIADELNSQFRNGRTAQAVRCQMFFLGLKSASKSNPDPIKRTQVMKFVAEGMRATAIAERMGVKKAAVNKMILLLHKDGLLDRTGTAGKSVKYVPSRKWVYGSDDDTIE